MRITPVDNRVRQYNGQEIWNQYLRRLLLHVCAGMFLNISKQTARRPQVELSRGITMDITTVILIINIYIYIYIYIYIDNTHPLVGLPAPY